MSPDDVERLLVEEALMYEIEPVPGRRLLALAGPIDRARDTVEQTLIALQLPDGRWQPLQKETRQVRLGDMEREAWAALHGPDASLAGDGPESCELAGKRQKREEMQGRYFIDYRQRFVGPCILCGIPLIGSGPVGVYYRNTCDSGYLCEPCFHSEAPRLGALLRALHDLKAAVCSSGEAEAAYQSLLESLLAINELDGWDPRLPEGTVSGPGIRFNGVR